MNTRRNLNQPKRYWLITETEGSGFRHGGGDGIANNSWNDKAANSITVGFQNVPLQRARNPADQPKCDRLTSPVS